MKIKKAVFPAAGLGTRFLPATKAQPKEMLPLVDKPLIQFGVEEARDSGIEEVLLLVGARELLKIILIVSQNWNWRFTKKVIKILWNT